MSLPANLLPALQTYVGPAAWDYAENTMENPVDVDAAYDLYGDVRLVAADVLEAAATDANGKAATAGGTKTIKLGGLQVDKVVTGTVNGVNASAWLQRAASLRQQVRASARASSVSVSVLSGL